MWSPGGYRWLSTLITCPSESRTKKRRTPHGSSVSGWTICAPVRTARRVAGIHVIHLNRGIGDHWRRLVMGHKAELYIQPFGIGQRDDPVMVHHRLQPKYIAVEASGCLQRPASEVRNHAVNTHGHDHLRPPAAPQGLRSSVPRGDRSADRNFGLAPGLRPIGEGHGLDRSRLARQPAPPLRSRAGSPYSPGYFSSTRIAW